MEKYRRVLKDRSEVAPKEEIRVTASGRPFSYVNYAEKLFKTEEQKSITIRATGMAIATAILVAEVSKRRFDGLHQITTVGVTDIVDEYAPIEDGLDTIQETRSVPFISIVLAKEVTEEDKLKVGYQPPVDQSLVKTVEMDQLRSAPGRRRPSRGRGGGRGGVGGPRGGRRRRGSFRGGRGGEGAPAPEGGSGEAAPEAST
eukprot:Polyplicarium_translucidae@DN1501_c0_g1_i2.p1